MQLDIRKKASIIFVGEGARLGKRTIEIGDEATLHHNGKNVKARITNVKETQIIGKITSSEYYPENPGITIGREIRFLEENIFEIFKMPKKD